MAKPWEEYQQNSQAPGEKPWEAYASAQQPVTLAQQPDKQGAVSAGEAILGIPRQIGLGARAVIKGVSSLPATMADIAAVPLRAMTGGRYFPSPSATLERNLSAVGLPEPQNANERVAQDAIGMMAGQGLISRAGSIMANSAGPVVSRVGESLASAPLQQMVGAGGAGFAGAATREAGGTPLAQFGASLAGGITGAGATEFVSRLYDGIKNSIGNAFNGRQNMQQINITLNGILKENGINLGDVPPMVRAELASEVKKALDTGKQINPNVVKRIADYGVVGAVPTRGTVTLDPVQITQEKNLSKMGANSSDPRLQELARLQNTNNAKFIENLNNLGASTVNSDERAVGGKLISTIQGQDSQAKASVDAAYGMARDNLGRAAPMDAKGFSEKANLALDEGMLGHYLPTEVRSILNDISTGKIPFNVNTAVQVDSVLSQHQRSAGMRSPQALAIGKIRDALNSAGIADNIGESAKRDFDMARGLAKQRFTWQESSPAIAAALDNPNQDRFVRDFILANGNKSSTADVEKLLFTVKKNPDAMQAIKENVAAYLKNKALSGASDEVGNFSQSAYNKALNELGDMKLRLFFSADELKQLKALGRVASYEMAQPKGSAVNNSNTAGTFAALIDKIASNPLLGRVPFADSAIRQPAKNWSAQIQSGNALNAGGAIAQAQKQPLPKLSDLSALGLSLMKPGSYGVNDDRRD